MPAGKRELDVFARAFNVRTKGKLGPLLVTVKGPLLRIFKSKYDDPLGIGFGSTRFSDPRYERGKSTEGLFRTLYATVSLETAMHEAILRDRCDGLTYPFAISRSELHRYSVCKLRVKQDLRLLDLRPPKSGQIGVGTDVVRGKDHAEAQKIAYALHESHAGLDGVVYPSRFTGEDNIAVFDRDVPYRLEPMEKPMPLTAYDLTDFLVAQRVVVVDSLAEATAAGRALLPEPT